MLFSDWGDAMRSLSKDGMELVIFGGTGDLSMRMLLPSLFHLDSDGLLSQEFRIILIGRKNLQGEALLDRVKAALTEFSKRGNPSDEVWLRFSKRLVGLSLNVDEDADFGKLAEILTKENRIYYLATPPGLYGPICSKLAAAGLTGAGCSVVLEKPIGRDLASSRAINAAVAEIFPESAIFRIDHYLGKETVQNLMALRFANILFEPLWNSQRIDHVQITVAETVGVEGRWAYYDHSGATRDMLQNHLLQLLCLVAMEPPIDMSADAVRDEKVKVLRSLRPLVGSEALSQCVLGQYTDGRIDGVPVPGYRYEKDARQSATDTFVAVRAEINNWRWAGVPFYLRTGKRLPTRYSEIYIQFRDVPHSVFGWKKKDIVANRLSIRLQPDEAVKLFVMNKLPGIDQEFRLHELPLNLTSVPSENGERRRIAYERLLLDIIKRNATLFVRRDEVEAAWAWIDGIVEGWRGQEPREYSAGSWGPHEAVHLPRRYGHSWHN